MVRAGGVLCVAGLCATASGCSLILDFGPNDADQSLYTQEDCDYKEPNDAYNALAMVDATDVGPAAICPGDPADRDLYRFTVPFGTATVSVRVAFVSRPGGDLDLRITDAAGATMYGQSSGFEDEEVVVCPGASPVCPTLDPGDYVFEVFPATPGAVNRYDFAVTLTPM